MTPRTGPGGEALLLLATAVAAQLAMGRTEEQVAVMAAFFAVLGDSLALLALEAPEAPEQDAAST
ncbi:MAG: hypothetical protein LKK00_06530 [Intestinimonas sp.]|jgi:hypothetical protein|nr:hypothetical protein [Intestinimonas sp.]